VSDRWRAVAVAGHTGDEATARAAVVDPDPVVREIALGALERLGALDDDVLMSTLADDTVGVRRRAISIAARRPHIDLAPALADSDPTVVEAAAWAVGEQEAAQHVATLIALATGADEPLVREAAVAALGAIGDERGLPAILAACTDKPAVRRRAVLALAPFEGPEVEAALRAALDDRDWQVRQAAEDVLPRAGG
jgi:HEAT repeat protein